MSQSDWKSLVSSLTKVQKMVHLAMRMDTVDERRIASEIFGEKRKAYESTLTDLVKKAGCSKTGKSGSATLSEIKSQSGDEASGIVATYNRDLVYEIKRISSVYPKANRHVYAINLRDWDKERAAWKSVQISLHNTGEWSSRAISEFHIYNDITGTARLVPANTAVCDICKEWVKRGTVKLDEAKKAIQSWPPHLGCVHSWEIKLGKVTDCSELWVGAEAGDMKEVSDAIQEYA